MPKKQNILQAKYGAEKRWVNYALMQVKGRKTKIPFSPITRRKASSTDAATWGTYDEAIAVNKDQIGIVFTPEKNLLGVDLDHCLEGTTLSHEHQEQIAQLIIEADTYTEISPSGTGLHLYFALSEPLSLTANRHDNFEAYTEGRYFTVTGNPYKEIRDVRTVTKEEALALLKIIGYPWGKEEEPIIASLQNGSVMMINTDMTPLKMGTLPVWTSHDELLKKMFASKGGAKMRNLYNGDLSDYKDDASTADMAFVSHLAFWTRKDPQAMESIWIASPLGSREKTQKRKDYRDRTIKSAIKGCKEVYVSKEEKMKDEAPDLELMFILNREKEKVFVQNTENMCRILRHHPVFKSMLRYDIFRNLSEIKRKGVFRELKDSDLIDIQTEISVLFPIFSRVNKEMVKDAMVKIFTENEYDSAADWLKSLVWDKKPRLDTWLINTYHATDDVYHRAVGSNWMKGLVKRLIEPGCKFDHVLVLEGEQGIRKSTSLAIIGSPVPGTSWHVETAMSTDNKDFFMQFQGKAIIEFSEGETLNRTEVKRMKAIITMQSDKFRPPFGKLSIDFPRRCVFAMTTNQQEYLKDETGNRRWLPVACDGNVDIEWLMENRDQLYAEAYVRVIINKETVHEFPEKETKQVQSSRRIHDPNEDIIADWYFNKLNETDRDQGITIHQAYRDGLYGGMAGKPLSKFDEMALSNILEHGLNLTKSRKRIHGIQSNRWFMTAESVQGSIEMPETEQQKAYGKF